MVATINLDRRVQRLEDAKCYRRELELRRKFHQDLEDAEAQRRLSDASRIDDPNLLDRLVAAGFDSSTIAALPLIPIAMVAWASGTITDRENRAVIDAVFASDSFNHFESVRRFREWLVRRPCPSLMRLWEEFTAATLADLPASDRERAGRQLLDCATQIATASGGMFGMSPICDAEQAILDRIKQTYQLA